MVAQLQLVVGQILEQRFTRLAQRAHARITAAIMECDRYAFVFQHDLRKPRSHAMDCVAKALLFGMIEFYLALGPIGMA
ncbi:hypothetical protein DYGSA30_45780 [Dyella sp. GSA-30]|nr:hypothetical protein DYGSA30_45780 [Dyella sp. GSA-30]